MPFNALSDNRIANIFQTAFSNVLFYDEIQYIHKLGTHIDSDSSQLFLVSGHSSRL